MNTTIKYTIPSLLQNSVKQYADKTSLIFAGEKNYTYRELGEDVKSTAGMLKKLGVNHGDKVAILSTNMPNWGVAYFAVSWIGATAVPILPDFHTNEIESIIEHSEAKVLFVSELLYKSLSERTLQMVDHVVTVENFALVPDGTTEDELSQLET
ncbi:MAG: AMP-binding protein, partial [Mariniphaga sp.]